jgi:endosialidase-like protein/trimeric autotransporter adhesin
MKALAHIFVSIILLPFVSTQAQDVKANLSGYKASQGFTVFTSKGDTVLTVRGTGRTTIPGNLGIGTSNPDATLHVAGDIKITGGSPGGGKVLVSDTKGLASWKTLASGGSTLDKAYDYGGAGAGRTITADNGPLTVDGSDGFVSTGTLAFGAPLSVSGQGVRMFWYPKKAAFRAGRVGGGDWDDSMIGEGSTAFGLNTRATGQFSFAAGSFTTSSGISSIVAGTNSQAAANASVAMGTTCEATEINAVAMGSRAIASGIAAIALGNYVTAGGHASIALGQYMNTGTHSGTCMIGDNSAILHTNAASSNRFYGRFDNGYYFYTSTNLSSGIRAAHNATSWSSLSDSAKKERFLAADGEATLGKFRALRLGSWNFKGHDPAEYRHYGPMAQEWYTAFGHDGVGNIGNDTTLASADVDGVLCIAVQALAARTDELREALDALEKTKKENNRLSAQLREMQSSIKQLNSRMDMLEIQQKMNTRSRKREVKPRFEYLGEGE